MFAGHAAQLHTKTLGLGLCIHKAHTGSSQTILERMGQVLMKFHLSLKSCWHLMGVGEGKPAFCG